MFNTSDEISTQVTKIHQQDGNSYLLVCKLGITCPFSDSSEEFADEMIKNVFRFSDQVPEMMRLVEKAVTKSRQEDKENMKWHVVEVLHPQVDEEQSFVFAKANVINLICTHDNLCNCSSETTQ